MTLANTFGRTVRSLAVGGAVLGLVGMSAAPRPAHAVDPGAAAGIGLVLRIKHMIHRRPSRHRGPLRPQPDRLNHLIGSEH